MTFEVRAFDMYRTTNQTFYGSSLPLDYPDFTDLRLHTARAVE